jgi:hypothetical protein
MSIGNKEFIMRAMLAAGVVMLPLLVSCGGTPSLAPTTTTQAGATQAPVAAPPASAASAASPASVPSPSPNVAKAAPPATANAAAKLPASTAPTPKGDGTAADAAKPKAPPLDLASLEERLKSTNAIGVMTKITLKNQVDDLLGQFRAYYQGKLKTTLADLRQSYNLLVQKVLALLQDSDPSLATAIVASRDAIWGILSDPKKFATI